MYVECPECGGYCDEYDTGEDYITFQCDDCGEMVIYVRQDD